MFKNYFTTACRFISRNKFFSLVNILGLSSGLAVCILIAIFVFDEFSYDQFNHKADRIFRIECDISVNGNGINSTYVPAPMAIQMVKDFLQIENSVRIRKQEFTLVKKDGKNIMESNVVFTDPSLFDVFTLPIISGSSSNALQEPNSIVISEKAAKKYFNSTDVIGKTLYIDNTATYKVTGVIKNIPQESHFHFDFIKSMPADAKRLNDAWLNPWAVTYVLAKPGISTKDINKLLTQIEAKYVTPQLQQMNQGSNDAVTASDNFFRFHAMPLNKIHLFSNISMEFEPNGKIQTAWIFIIVAILILVIACVNFMNLSTAFSSRRSLEIGIRKILGGNRGDLIIQFLVESVFITFVASCLAIMFAILLLPYFNELSGKHFTTAIFSRGWIIGSLVLLALFTGLIAGSYPAIYLSSFKPVRVLKEFLVTGQRSSWLRNSLVIFQFAVANILIVGTLVIFQQFTYIKARDLGYNRNQVLVIPNTGALEEHARTFKDEVDQLPGVIGGTMTSYLPDHDFGGARAYFKDATANPRETFLLNEWTVESNYVPLMGMKIVKGRNFSPLLSGDSSCVLINETAARLLGYLAYPVNQAVYLHDSNPEGGFKIIGVVKDFNASSLHNKIEPIIFRLGGDIGAVSFRINTKHIASLIGLIKNRYNALNTAYDQPFTWSFLDDDFNNLYKSDERTGKIYTAFTLFAILIACLGLFGLVAYAGEQRIKEIGIRKVLGASTVNVIALLSKDFLKLIIIAIIIACPLAFWASHRWLQDFAYRTTLNPWFFIIAALLTIAITWLTIFLQSVKVASQNPAIILRDE
jgi:putative ABC transport system permease protein